MVKRRDGQKRAAKVAARRRRRTGATTGRQPQSPEQWDAEPADGADDDATDAMLATTSEALRGVVAATLEQRDADIARAWHARLVDADEHVRDEDDRSPGQWFADLAVTTRLLQVGRQADGGDLARRAVGWVAELGESAPAVERLGVALLDQPQDVAAVEPCIVELGDDYLPAMVWLLTGAVAVAGDGDVRWLDALDPGE
ncbi:hypothetical protein [Actinomycetospora aeridis]|uniref:Uncharacterized protein n=1 Tax=Actinomycetospora aeridis TaxID=3129231 RepID=A0ABU8NEG2_9PSEU